MITKEKILEILKNNSQKSVIGWAVEEEDFELVAEELVKNCSIPNVVGRSEQLCDEWIHEERVKQNDDTYCPICGKKLQ